MSSSSAGRSPHNDTPDRCPRLTHDARSTHIIETAIGLFARKGFQGTKTKEIADAAGINEALIFRDFHTKEGLYCAILEYASGRIKADRWIGRATQFAEQRDDRALFSTLAFQFIHGFGAERNLYRLMLYSALEHHELACKFRQRHTEPVERFIEEYMRRRQEEGAFRGGDPHAFARHFLNMCHHHVLRQVLFCDPGEPAADAATAQSLTEIFLDGVRAH
jgi:TetR/AcrR family transcriptional regulator